MGRYNRSVEEEHPYILVQPNTNNLVLQGPLGGGIGDLLSYLIIQPAVAAIGVVSVTDGPNTIVTVPATTLTELRPIVIPLHVRSKHGPWRVKTGASVTVLAIGEFQ